MKSGKAEGRAPPSLAVSKVLGLQSPKVGSKESPQVNRSRGGQFRLFCPVSSVPPGEEGEARGAMMAQAGPSRRSYRQGSRAGPGDELRKKSDGGVRLVSIFG